MPTPAALFRPVGLADSVALCARALEELTPDEPQHPEDVRRHFEGWELDSKFGRYEVTVGGEVAGFAFWAHDREWADGTPSRARVEPAPLARHLEPWLVREMLVKLEADCRQEGVELSRVRVRETETVRPEVLAGMGYEAVRRQRWWELELGPAAGRLAAMAAESRARVAAEGVRLTTVAAEGGSEDLLRRVYAASAEAERDVPGDLPSTPDSYEQFIHHLQSPGIGAERAWIAVATDGRVLGLSMLQYPTGRGNVWTAWTGTARAGRGRGLARALKLETLMQALDAGVERVRTTNDEGNAPILHLNEAMGYRAIPGTVLWSKRLPT